MRTRAANEPHEIDFGSTPRRLLLRPLTLPELVLVPLAVLAIGSFDVLSGHELTASPFYVLVVAFMAWRRGRTPALGTALFCASVGVLADHLSSGPALALPTSFSHPAIPWWNGFARLLVYACIATAIGALQESLRARHRLVEELQQALAEVRTLEGLLPMCAWCKQIRDEERGGAWFPLDQYVAHKTSAAFTHGICPGCAANELGVRPHARRE